jgi:hypothetical protein
MTGHRPFKELTKGFSEVRKARVAARLSKLEAETASHERQALQEDSAPVPPNFTETARKS